MKRTALVLAVGSFFVFGCAGTYRVVKKTQAGGELALVGPQESAREAADKYMASQCAKGFDVVEEGEAVVGSTTTSHGTAQNTKTMFGKPAVSTSSTADTTDKREWRIKYQCKGETAPAAAAFREVVLYF